MNSSFVRRMELVFLVLLTVAAFGVRLYRVGLISLAEDEAVTWNTIQSYKHGNFAGANSEHPLLMKLLA